MQQVQPRMQEIQTLYAGDQVKIQQEMQKLYQETGFNPLAGCLPMLIQMPIFIILFQVLRDKIGQYAGGDLAISFYNILPNLTQTVPDAFNQGVTYAILCMNACAVLLDKIGRPVKFGAPKKEAAKK